MNIFKYAIVSIIIGVFGYLAYQSNASAIPEHVYRMDRFEQAQDEALAEGNPLVLLYTDEETTCGRSKAATRDTFEYFRHRSIEVCVRSNIISDWHLLPRFVKHAFNSPQAGRYIPRTVVVNPEMTELIAVIPYTRKSEDRKRLFEQGSLLIEEYFEEL